MGAPPQTAEKGLFAAQLLLQTREAESSDLGAQDVRRAWCVTNIACLPSPLAVPEVLGEPLGCS